MSTSNNFDYIIELGVEHVHRRTHIARDKIELLFDRQYTQIPKVQFMGFISILEREFNLELDDAKKEYLEFRKEFDQTKIPTSSPILRAVSNEKRKKIFIGVAILIVVILSAVYIQYILGHAPKADVIELDSPKIVPQPSASSELLPQSEVADQNLVTLPENKTVPQSLTSDEQSQQMMTSPIEDNSSTHAETETSNTMVIGKKIIFTPASKVWYGTIELATQKRHQKVTSDAIVLDPVKDYLILLGHGRMTIETEKGIKKLKERDNVWFLLEKGILKQISQDEFIKRNNGKNW